ncbi:hypothetical protein BV898_10144 [Hypsibius exemplaris]|uniref:Uncharacterized protein n=1 Tax=Hypsibius exemplaris TaxID=2072580 RepID=A0A1W0WKC5_HYPEX|nr:hypothetical protein BV898_10144 [Hypsibius exemplaris]
MTCDLKCQCYLAAAYSIVPPILIVIGAACLGCLFALGSSHHHNSRRDKVLAACGLGGILVSLTGTVCLFLGLAQDNPFLLLTWLIVFGIVTAIWTIATVGGSFGYFCIALMGAANNPTPMRLQMSRTSIRVAVGSIFLYIGVVLNILCLLAVDHYRTTLILTASS